MSRGAGLDVCFKGDSECRTGSEPEGQEWMQKAAGTVQVEMEWLGSQWQESGRREVDKTKVRSGVEWTGLWTAWTQSRGRSRGQERLLGFWLNRRVGADGGKMKSSALFQCLHGGEAKGPGTGAVFSSWPFHLLV